jgi:hypothetical protein
VLVKDENGTPIPEAMVGVTWTLPDGTPQDQFTWTNAKGLAPINTTGPAGTYQVTVTSIYKSLYTFNPKKSVLTGTVSVP